MIKIANQQENSDSANTPFVKKIVIAVVAIGIFIIAIQSKHWLSEVDWFTSLLKGLPAWARLAEQPMRWLLFCICGLLVAHRMKPWRVFAELGMTKPIHTGIGFGFVATLPMFIVALVFCHVRKDLNVVELIGLAGTYVFAEELLFRGYLFGQLNRRAGWNLWLAAIAVGVLFGALHLVNQVVKDMPIADQFGTVAIISMGGVLFAWVYAKWDCNLWVAISLHGFMNLWFSIFQMGDNPLGGWILNGSRILSGVFAVLITLYFLRKRRANQSAPQDKLQPG